MGSTRFRNPQALSSALAGARALQPRAFGFLNRVDPLVSVSNYYIFVQRELSYVAESHTGTIGEQQLKPAKLLVANIQKSLPQMELYSGHAIYIPNQYQHMLAYRQNVLQGPINLHVL